MFIISLYLKLDRRIQMSQHSETEMGTFAVPNEIKSTVEIKIMYLSLNNNSLLNLLTEDSP